MTVSLEPFPLQTQNLYHWIQQRLRFIKTCSSIVTSPSQLELSVLEVNHVFMVLYALVILCDHIFCVPDLLAYASLIISAARRFKGSGWQVYDANFRSQAAANSLTVWAQTNSSLWTTLIQHRRSRQPLYPLP